MTIIKPFAAFLANKKYIKYVIYPPFDLATAEEETKRRVENDKSFYLCENPTFGPLEGKDAAEKGREHLQNHITKGHLIRDCTERIYIYSQVWKDLMPMGTLTYLNKMLIGLIKFYVV